MPKLKSRKAKAKPIFFLVFPPLPHDLVIYQLLQLLLAEVVLVLVKVKEFLWDWGSRWLIFWIMIWLEVGMRERLFHSDAFHGVEGQEFLEEVEGEVGGFWEHRLERDFLLEGEGADVLPSATRLNAVVIFQGGCAKHVED